MLKRIITIAIVVAVVGVIINDAYAYSTAQQSLQGATYDLALLAAKSADSMNRDQVASELAVLGPQKGVVVYQYGQTDEGVQVWARSTVGNTLVLGTVMNLIDGKGFSEARTAPYVIEAYKEAGVQ